MVIKKKTTFEEKHPVLDKAITVILAFIFGFYAIYYICVVC
jgi:hypothetical protein